MPPTTTPPPPAERLAVTVLRAVAAEGGQATTRRLVAATGRAYAPRSALRHALRQLTAVGQLVAEPDHRDDVAGQRWLITDRGRRVVGAGPTAARRLRVAAATLRDAAEWAEGMAAEAPLMAGRWDGLVALLARSAARSARSAVDAGHSGGRAAFQCQLATLVAELVDDYPDDRRVDRPPTRRAPTNSSQ